MITDKAFRPVIAAAGLEGPKKKIILEAADSPLLNFLAVSPSMVPPDPRWVPTRVQTGYWYLDLPGYVPPAGLRAFVEGGEPPLAIGFGSMAGVDAKHQTEVIVRSVEQLGRRAVLLSGWGELGKGDLPPFIHLADHVPHDWLYPRSSLVVHHGGAGTTAAVARAGVPQAIVWHIGDQPTWGALVGEARAGTGAAAPPEAVRGEAGSADHGGGPGKPPGGGAGDGRAHPGRGRGGRGGAGDLRAGAVGPGSVRRGRRETSRGASPRLGAP